MASESSEHDTCQDSNAKPIKTFKSNSLDRRFFGKKVQKRRDSDVANKSSRDSPTDADYQTDNEGNTDQSKVMKDKKEKSKEEEIDPRILELLGLEGNTGSSTGEHLHMELKKSVILIYQEVFQKSYHP